MVILYSTDLDSFDQACFEKVKTKLQQQHIDNICSSSLWNVMRERAISYALLMCALQFEDKKFEIPRPIELSTSECMSMIESYGAETNSLLPLFIYDLHGKPHMQGSPYEFNMSHCRTFVAVATDKTPVGIDVESKRKVSRTLIEHVCNDAELEVINSQDDATSIFLHLWTRKESYVKYTGTGLTIPLKHILDDVPTNVCQETHAIPKVEGWLTVSYQKQA